MPLRRRGPPIGGGFTTAFLRALRNSQEAAERRLVWEATSTGMRTTRPAPIALASSAMDVQGRAGAPKHEGAAGIDDGDRRVMPLAQPVDLRRG